MLQTANIRLLDSAKGKEEPQKAPRLANLLPQIRSALDEYAKSSRVVEPGGALYVLAVVPAVWTRGETLAIRFELFNDGYDSQTATLSFAAYDNAYLWNPFTIEFSVHEVVTVRRFSYVVKNLYVTVPERTAVGIKGGVARAEGDAHYYKDFGYKFVQKFGDCDLRKLPPKDNASAETHSPTYYWEGLPNDGLNIPSQYSIYHPTDWNIIWNAGNMADFQWNWEDWSYYYSYQPAIVASKMTWKTFLKMHYEFTDEPPYYFTGCALSDLLILQAGWRGVCDEYATIEVSMLRALGIPARQLEGESSSVKHAWLEVWVCFPVALVPVWSWIHADPTKNLWDMPWYYRWIEGYTVFRITCDYDDSRKYVNYEDGPPDNGRLGYFDDMRIINYDGPNNY